MQEEQGQEENKGIRLNRFLGNSGICTRREADKIIAKGLVLVDGKVVKEMGYRVKPNEKVTYMGDALSTGARKYILINKPKDCVSSKKRSRGQRSIYDIVEYACSEDVSPISELSINTTGVILMTNDIELTKKLKDSKRELFHVFLRNEMNDTDLEKLRNGIQVGNKLVKPDGVEYANVNDKSEIGIEIHSTPDFIIQKMLTELGYKINRMDRVLYGSLSKKNLPRGRWRALTTKEIQFLNM